MNPDSTTAIHDDGTRVNGGLNLNGAMFGLGGEPVPACVQAHALHRLWERLELDHLRYIANVTIRQACQRGSVVQRDGDTCWLVIEGPEGARASGLGPAWMDAMQARAARIDPDGPKATITANGTPW